MSDEIDRLYELPLEEFTAARNALAKETGDAALKQLKKPTVPAWAVNQLARRREVDMRRLLRAAKARGGAEGGAPRREPSRRSSVRAATNATP